MSPLSFPFFFQADDGIRDLYVTGVQTCALPISPLDDPHDEGHLAAAERAARVWLGDLEMHRRNPLVHLAGLDLACYDRDYAPQRERDEARARHLAAWPEAIAAAVEALD